jgi:phosphorylase kinase alpha/beta subunit
MPPFEIKQLLQATLWQDSTRSALYQRQLNGALNRVPGNFYVKVYGILKKTPGGISLRGKSLPQCPTIQLMSGHQRSFSKEVETLLSGINRPEYRQLVVELLMVVSTILERNEELVHQRTIDLDKLLNDAFEMLNEDIKHNVVRIDNHQQVS